MQTENTKNSNFPANLCNYFNFANAPQHNAPDSIIDIPRVDWYRNWLIISTGDY